METLNQIKANKLNFVKSCLVFLIFSVIGIGISIPGPSLLDLQIAVNCSIAQIGYLIPVRAFGYTAGSVLGGLIPQMYDKQPYLLACHTVASIFLGLLPWNQNLTGLLFTTFIGGTFFGIADVCGAVFIIDVWGKNSVPFVQSMYFLLGIGSLVAPLIVEPFLLPIRSDNNVGEVESLYYTPEDVKLRLPYALVTIYALSLSFIFGLIYCIQSEVQTEQLIEEEYEQPSANQRQRIKLAVAIASIFVHFQFGNELTFGSLLTIFVVKSDLKLSKSSGAYMTSVYWSTFTFFRFVCIFLTQFCGVETTFLLEMGLTIFGNILLINGAYCFISEMFIWFAGVTLGLGISSCYPLTILYLQQYFPIKNSIISILLVTASFGEFLYPLIAAQYIDEYPNSFVVVCTFCTVTSLIFFFCLKFFCQKLLS